MTSLFDPARHEALAGPRWDAALARSALQRIAAEAIAAFEPGRGWPAHARDDPEAPGQRFDMLYMGSGGVIWALQHLARSGVIETPPPALLDEAQALPERNRALTTGWGYGTASYFMGDAGLMLLQHRLAPSAALADALYAVVEGNFGHPAREPLWGSPGTLIAALHMAERTGEARWRMLLQRGLEHLWQQMQFDESAGGVWLWRQDLYGKQRCFLGAAHGFVGNLYPALRGAALLDPALVARFLERGLATLEATALRDEAGRINWHGFADPALAAKALPLVQDCHGAPGVICRLAGAPRTPAWDALLLAAGELIWHAGPLAKGAGLCHGSAGNGWALLKLARRSGEERWLDRARAFAMHAIGQVEQQREKSGHGWYSLWTGDLGVALFLAACLSGDDACPTLDVF
ncbi:lanthionine synthetase [Aquincola sp. S2]|uniref:Lanthionine synthetase n=1 Tax=Pseudaquabacterium terrae TaxID=2732868 RepID=A0ABX2EEJ3_9BURK|nr:LanC-like protein [Aquabacterium terrae]NRF67040.1 lanthionine synthetase [Aquabacterium terrae]